MTGRASLSFRAKPELPRLSSRAEGAARSRGICRVTPSHTPGADRKWGYVLIIKWLDVQQVAPGVVAKGGWRKLVKC